MSRGTPTVDVPLGSAGEKGTRGATTPSPYRPPAFAGRRHDLILAWSRGPADGALGHPLEAAAVPPRTRECLRDRARRRHLSDRRLSVLATPDATCLRQRVAAKSIAQEMCATLAVRRRERWLVPWVVTSMLRRHHSLVPARTSGRVTVRADRPMIICGVCCPTC